jgi:hypothetical protein
MQLSAYAETPPAHSLDGCLNALEDTAKPAVTCSYWALLSDDEREDLRRLTRGVLQDASCKVEVSIDRKLMTEALATGDTTFDAPPQPVTCEIKTSSSVMPVAGTFAPHVVFKDGVATDGTPGLANVTGVNAYLAWPVVQYVNRAPGIRRDMLAMINAYKASRQPHMKAELGPPVTLR